MQPDTEELMKKLHASLCPDKLEAEIRDKFMVLEAEIERLNTLYTNSTESHEETVGRAMLAEMYQRNYATALAECRDAFPAPKPFGTLDSYYVGAMSDPLAVPEYIGMCVTAGSKDTELLDFLETEHYDNVFPLGKTWYSRLAYGQPYKKHNTLRSAIITAVNNKGVK